MPGTRKRPHSISSWLSTQELTAFAARCEAGGRTRSAAIRALVAEYAAGRSAAPEIHRELRAMREECRRVGVNLNQLLRLAHTDVLMGNAPDLGGFVGVTDILARAVERLVTRLTPYMEAR